MKINRAKYWVAIAAFALFSFAVSVLDESSPLITVSAIGYLASGALMLALIPLRLMDIGYSGWIGLLALVPIASLWVGLVCLFRKSGFVAERAQLKAAMDSQRKNPHQSDSEWAS